MMSYVAAHAGRMCVKSSSNHGCHHYWLTPTSTHTHTLYRPFSFAQSTGTWHQKTGTVLFPSATSSTFYGFWCLFKILQEELYGFVADYSWQQKYTELLLLYGCGTGTWSVLYLRLISWPTKSRTKLLLVRNWEMAASIILSPRQRRKHFKHFFT